MSFYSYLANDDLKDMSVVDLKKEEKKLMQQVKIIQCFIQLSENQNYGLELRFKFGRWHFNFCEYFIGYKICGSDDSKWCNCLDFIFSTKGIEQLFDIIKNDFDNFNLPLLCKNFEEFSNINKPQNIQQQIDIVKNLFDNIKNDKNFMTLYKSLLTPEKDLEAKQYIQLSTTLLPILDKLKVKKYLFNNLMQKWMEHNCFAAVNEQIQFFSPHLLSLYIEYIDEYSTKFLKVKDLVEVLDNLTNSSCLPPPPPPPHHHQQQQQQEQIIELEIKSLYDDKGKILNSDDFEKSLKKFKGSKYEILNAIVEIFGLEQQQQIKDPVCYIVALRIVDEEKNLIYRMPFHKYQSYDDLIGDRSKVLKCIDLLKDTGVNLSFINEKLGYHFNFCPNFFYYKFKYRFCNCLKYICDGDDNRKIFDVMKKYAKQFRICLLREHFEYLDFAFNSQIKVLDEIFHDKDFNELYKNLDKTGYIIPGCDVKPTAFMPMLEKLKVRRKTFQKLLINWGDKGYYYPQQIFGYKQENKYPHCMNIYKMLVDETDKLLEKSYLIFELQKLNKESKIYLEVCYVHGRRLQILEGNKEKVIQEILNNDDSYKVFIKKLKIDDDDEAIYNKIPYHYFSGFDEVG